jgi:hypothetical protein
MKFIHVRARNSDDITLSRGGLTIAVEQRASDGMLMVAMAKCPEHQLFDETKGEASQASARLVSCCYTIMTVEALAKYVKEPVESLKAELVVDGSTQN